MVVRETWVTIYKDLIVGVMARRFRRDDHAFYVRPEDLTDPLTPGRIIRVPNPHCITYLEEHMDMEFRTDLPDHLAANPRHVALGLDADRADRPGDATVGVTYAVRLEHSPPPKVWYTHCADADRSAQALLADPRIANEDKQRAIIIKRVCLPYPTFRVTYELIGYWQRKRLVCGFIREADSVAPLTATRQVFWVGYAPDALDETRRLAQQYADRHNMAVRIVTEPPGMSLPQQRKVVSWVNPAPTTITYRSDWEGSEKLMEAAVVCPGAADRDAVLRVSQNMADREQRTRVLQKVTVRGTYTAVEFDQFVVPTPAFKNDLGSVIERVATCAEGDTQGLKDRDRLLAVARAAQAVVDKWKLHPPTFDRDLSPEPRALWDAVDPDSRRSVQR